MPLVGSKITHVSGNDALSARTITSGSVRVLGVLVANTDDAAEDTVTLTNSAGATILTIECAPNTC